MQSLHAGLFQQFAPLNDQNQLFCAHQSGRPVIPLLSFWSAPVYSFSHWCLPVGALLGWLIPGRSCCRHLSNGCTLCPLGRLLLLGDLSSRFLRFELGFCSGRPIGILQLRIEVIVVIAGTPFGVSSSNSSGIPTLG